MALTRMKFTATYKYWLTSALFAVYLLAVPSFCIAQQKIKVAGQPVELSLSSVTDHMIRITLLPLDASGRPVALQEDLVLDKRKWPEAGLRITTLKSGAMLQSKYLQARIQASPLAVVLYREGKMLQKISFNENSGNVKFLMGKGPLLGLGGGGISFDRRGTFDEMESGESPVTETQVFGHRLPVPFLISTEGWSLFFHTPYKAAFDLRTGETGSFIPHAHSKDPEEAPLPLDIFVTWIDNPARALSEYAIITGKTPLPPKWAFGFMQSHRTLGDATSLLTEAKEFRDRKLPCDAMIYLGTGYTPSGWNQGHGSLDFNPKVFGNPDDILKKLHDDHFKVILHVNNVPHTLHGEMVPSATDTGRDYAYNYWKGHEPLYNKGIDGWWPDDGDELPIAVRLTRRKLYYKGSLMARPNKRSFDLQRSGHTGMNRYGGWVWSGDIFSLWSTLEAHVPVGINCSLSATPYWGSDIGGFFTTKEYTGELYARWFQFAAFTPGFRSHGRKWFLHRPWGWSTGEMGPDELGRIQQGSVLPDSSELLNPAIEPICKKYLELRYQLMPYTYSAARENYDTGLPLMRALWLHYPKDSMAVQCGNEYLWGRNILVAPVTEKGASTKKIYLPEGTWYDFWNNRKYEGRQTTVRYVDLSTMPLFITAGTILPLDPVRQYTDEPVTEPTVLRVYSGADGEYRLYEDDGSSLDYQNNKASWIKFRWSDNEKKLIIEPDAASGNISVSRAFKVQVIPVKRGEEARTITYVGQRLEVRF